MINFKDDSAFLNKMSEVLKNTSVKEKPPDFLCTDSYIATEEGNVAAVFIRPKEFEFDQIIKLNSGPIVKTRISIGLLIGIDSINPTLDWDEQIKQLDTSFISIWFNDSFYPFGCLELGDELSSMNFRTNNKKDTAYIATPILSAMKQLMSLIAQKYYIDDLCPNFYYVNKAMTINDNKLYRKLFKTMFKELIDPNTGQTSRQDIIYDETHFTSLSVESRYKCQCNADKTYSISEIKDHIEPFLKCQTEDLHYTILVHGDDTKIILYQCESCASKPKYIDMLKL